MKSSESILALWCRSGWAIFGLQGACFGLIRFGLLVLQLVCVSHFGGSYSIAFHLFLICYDTGFWLGGRCLHPKRTTGVCSDDVPRAPTLFFSPSPLGSGSGSGGAPRVLGNHLSLSVGVI
jgi:hypothetical protein